MAHALQLRTISFQPMPLLGATALAMLAGGTLVVAANVASHAIPADCWPIYGDPGWQVRGCDVMGSWFQTAAEPARGLRDVLAVVAPLLAIGIGVRLGTEAERWARSGDGAGTRGLVAALRPTALAGFGVILLLAILGAILGAALDTGRDWIPGRSIASGGVAMLGRAAVVASVAMLGTVLVRRQWAGAVLALAFTAGWAFGVLPILHGRIARDTARWLPAAQAAMSNGGGGEYAVFDMGAFDLSRPGVAGEPGARISGERYDSMLLSACGPVPADAEGRGDTPWAWCLQRLSADLLWELAAPADTAATFAVGEMGTGLAAAGTLFGLTGVVVVRRRR